MPRASRIPSASPPNAAHRWLGSPEECATGKSGRSRRARVYNRCVSWTAKMENPVEFSRCQPGGRAAVTSRSVALHTRFAPRR